MPRERPTRGDAPKLNIVGLCKQIANLANLEFAKSDAIGSRFVSQVQIVLTKHTLRASKLKKTDAYLPNFMIGTINMSHKLSSLGFTAAEDTLFTPH